MHSLTGADWRPPQTVPSAAAQCSRGVPIAPDLRWCPGLGSIDQPAQAPPGRLQLPESRVMEDSAYLLREGLIDRIDECRLARRVDFDEIGPDDVLEQL